jgi:hypothetical protein
MPPPGAAEQGGRTIAAAAGAHEHRASAALAASHAGVIAESAPAHGTLSTSTRAFAAQPVSAPRIA